MLGGLARLAIGTGVGERPGGRVRRMREGEAGDLEDEAEGLEDGAGDLKDEAGDLKDEGRLWLVRQGLHALQALDN